MRRTERLFQIIQILRSSRAPVTGARLAEELEVSLRTLYRDMAELTAQRVPFWVRPAPAMFCKTATTCRF